MSHVVGYLVYGIIAVNHGATSSCTPTVTEPNVNQTWRFGIKLGQAELKHVTVAFCMDGVLMPSLILV